jgi:Protein of unknown function (DUF3866)
MPLSLARGRVTAIVERLEGLVRLEVDGTACVAYPGLTGPVALDDEVLVNMQARELELGSGGFDVLYANLTRGLGLAPEPEAHVMKLPYTPLQVATRHVEEDAAIAESLDGMPVVCCSLHSQVAPACAALGSDVRTAYVQVPGGALPVSLSDAVRALKKRGLLEVSVAVGACLEGDIEAVTVASALAWAAAAGFDAVVCAVGPGIVGTGSPLGHGGLAAADTAHAAAALGGVPVLAVRASEGDPRERHRGVSHHTRSVVDLAPSEAVVAWPAGVAVAELLAHEEVNVTGWEEACAGLPLLHMGRGPEDDPVFFAAAYAAGAYARSLLR